MHGSELQAEMRKRSMILDHVQECRIILVHNQFGKKDCEHSVSERVAEIILSLPERFEKKKVSILDQGNLQNQFNWKEFLLYACSLRPSMIFKQLKLTQVNIDDPRIFGLLLAKC